MFDGASVGPLGWTAWNHGSLKPSWDFAKVNTAVPSLKKLKAPDSVRLMYYGGPYFEFKTEPANLEVWTRAVAPKGIPTEARNGADKPTTIRFSSGRGKVILFAYHPVFLLHGTLNGVSVQPLIGPASTYNDSSPLSIDEVNYWSWNILHAALRLTANQSVVPMPVQNIR